jgi:hypothetical protein
MKVGTIAPTPGIRPSTKPTTVPRPIAPADRRHSSRVGFHFLRSASIIRVSRRSAASSSSPMPNRPITTGTKPMPS